MEPPLLPGAMGCQLDEADPLPIVPLVLQVSPLPGSSDPEEFFYDPSPDCLNGAFAAAQAFFLDNGHSNIVHDCPDVAAFQASHPGISLFPLADLPAPVFGRGYELLQEAALAAVAALEEADRVAAAAIAPAIEQPAASTLMAHYAEIPSVSSFPRSSASHHLRGSPSIANALSGGLDYPDPDGLVHPLPVDDYCSHHGGHSSCSLRAYDDPPPAYPPVSPLCHGGLSISSGHQIYGGFPSIHPPQVHCHPHGEIVYDGLHSWVILLCSLDYATITLQLCKQKNALCFITVT
jgi:hypothetical protein